MQDPAWAGIMKSGMHARPGDGMQGHALKCMHHLDAPVEETKGDCTHLAKGADSVLRSYPSEA